MRDSWIHMFYKLGAFYKYAFMRYLDCKQLKQSFACYMLFVFSSIFESLNLLHCNKEWLYEQAGYAEGTLTTLLAPIGTLEDSSDIAADYLLDTVIAYSSRNSPYSLKYIARASRNS